MLWPDPNAVQYNENLDVTDKGVQEVLASNHRRKIVQCRFDENWQEWQVRVLKFEQGTESGYLHSRTLVTDTFADIPILARSLLED